MQRRGIAIVALAAVAIFAVAVGQITSSAQPTKPMEKKKSGYAPVNGLRMYYEIIGEGKLRRSTFDPIVSHCGLFSQADDESAVDRHGPAGPRPHGRHRSSDDVRTARRRHRCPVETPQDRPGRLLRRQLWWHDRRNDGGPTSPGRSPSNLLRQPAGSLSRTILAPSSPTIPIWSSGSGRSIGKWRPIPNIGPRYLPRS